MEGQPILNSYNCPLLTLMPSFSLINTAHIDSESAVSIMHECTDSCKFVDLCTTRTVERENVTTNTLKFEHDYNNSMHCLNIYFMYQYFGRNIHFLKFIVYICRCHV